MRSLDEVAAFEQALVELAQQPNNKDLPDLHLVFDDACQHPEVMFGLIHFLESFDLQEQLQAFIQVVPSLIKRAAEWTYTLHTRIANDAIAHATFEEMLQSLDAKGSSVYQLLAEVAAKQSPSTTTSTGSETVPAATVAPLI